MRDTAINIKVDIDDLAERLEAMREDDYVTAELAINSDGYSSELELFAVGIEDEEKLSYGKIEEQSDDFI
jgi:hypothetical protein